MTELDDRFARRLVQEVADRAPSPPEWDDVLGRLAGEAVPAQVAPARRPWVLVAAAGGVMAAAAMGVVVYQRVGTGPDGDRLDVSTSRTTTATLASPVPTTGAPSSSATAPPITGGWESRAPDSATAIFAPSVVPDGFRVVEASTWDGPSPYTMPRVSTETWISYGADGAIDGYVRLSANAGMNLPNTMPPEPTGVTVHGEVAQILASPDTDGLSQVAWDEEGMALFVATWGSDAVVIAERSIVTASRGIALPAGVLPDTFVRVESRGDPTLRAGRSSEVSWSTPGGERSLRLSARPNSTGETLDTIGGTPGARRVTTGPTAVWVWATGSGTAAAWLDGDHILSAGGDVDEATLLTFVAGVGRTSDSTFRALVLQASALDQAITERDRATFADGVQLSIHSDAAVDVPESSSFGPRSFCATGTDTFCTAQVTPVTEEGLLTEMVGWHTIDGERQLVAWVGAGRTVTRVYDADTAADLGVVTAAGGVGSFARSSVPGGVRTVVLEIQVPGREYPLTSRVNVALTDPLADVRSSNPSAG